MLAPSLLRCCCSVISSCHFNVGDKVAQGLCQTDSVLTLALVDAVAVVAPIAADAATTQARLYAFVGAAICVTRGPGGYTGPLVQGALL